MHVARVYYVPEDEMGRKTGAEDRAVKETWCLLFEFRISEIIFSRTCETNMAIVAFILVLCRYAGYRFADMLTSTQCFS